MLIKRKRGWELPESAVTPEAIYRNRRNFIKGIAAGTLGAAATALPVGRAFAQAAMPDGDLYPAKRNDAYKVDRDITPKAKATGYNNFYEFGSHKFIAEAAQALKTSPWTVKIDGMVEKPMEIDFEDLVRKMPLEERVYRFRCVEAWAMTVPWTGFPLKALVDFAKPMSGAKYIEMETASQEDTMPGLKQFWYPWPYVEGLTMAEATNELTMIATGLYGEPIPKQNGAPLRLVTPWKYGFKNIKSIVRFTFTDKRPVGYWERIADNEYGFWANVNPKVPHPRWSQAQERLLSNGEEVPTQLYNGYADYVADIYKGMDDEKLFM
ncbi:protein-methionine-sulfoxide reductase catalytic subunit MsrP [Thalassospira marina]|uniref:Protein-methionine-sulfoxide reductase catalytic subunit MsrP n=1 Tax=Thalassospira marina TaxID=2048283 RepID=A0A2N3KWY3_9PROT|nr:protein-methionine-sulfoxide reductase catalytic subunit MsrP [Thalassospira marina]AUG53954.1 protein-methionine-sulfoxide reductase catalytic subunit MsrP [Thalassospira marina]PKR55091.1 protein-methionine-sulfoxide reductase catalytic subunit MsrP [Thalassospira marina]